MVQTNTKEPPRTRRCTKETQTKKLSFVRLSVLRGLRSCAPSIGHSMHAAEDVQEQHNNQDQPEDPHASACSASQISVIATAAAECEHQDHNEQDQQHWESPSFFNS